MTTPTAGTPTPGGSATSSGINAVSGLPRLRAGELQNQVLAVLAHASSAMDVGDIAAVLVGRSSGAIGQACDRLTERGHADLLPGSPKRYRITAAGTAEHQANPTPIPSAQPQPARPASATAPATPTPPPPSATSATQPATTTHSTAAPAGPRKPTSGPVRRPNGQLYYPRLLAKRPDVDVLRDLRDADVPVLLYGPPGTGKTSLIEAAFGTDLYTVPGDGDTTVGDIVGDYVPTDSGGYEFVPGPLPQAMEAGGVLFIDDATLIQPKVLAVVYPAMDGRRQIILKAAAGRVVTAAPGFYIVAGHNPGVHGAVLTEALSSRFSTQVKVSSDYDLAAALGVDSRMVRAARNLATQYDSGEIGWAPQLRELLAFKRITDVLGIDTATANLIGLAPVEDRDVVHKAVGQAFAKAKILPLALGNQL
ncbi:AAA family ATPase [Verrucosispora sp. WMMA2044]|uniref:AAA family ATPase n=1 Tax=Verrucosispora sp. WMMA2044 TaxID=3016419 RepID=UPI00248BBB26|nr:AAA family ATPase [Verrucosispora sp. WMMA2044]WBB48450.1 AAA family ATPase [Verrucosispora sp. WMMA2044]